MTPAERTRTLVLATRVLVPLVILGLGFAVFGLLVATAPQVAKVEQAAAPPEVVVFRAQPTPVRRQWRGYGTAEAESAADVPARVTATVAEVPAGIQEGAAVEAGQLLVRLDPSDFERRVEQARQALAAIGAQLVQLAAEEESLRERLPIEENDVQIAERELARVRSVVERGAGNQQDLDAAERALLAARRNRWQVTQALAQLAARRSALEAQQSAQEASLRLAQDDLSRTRITSPIAGVLQSVPVKLGENVREGEVVARVANLAEVEVPVRLPASARLHVGVGDEAFLQATSQPELCWNATIDRASPEDDPQTRTMTAYLMVEQAEELATGRRLLHPGRFVEATVTSAAEQERWVVPRRAVRAGRVFVVRDGVLASVPVEVDFAIEGDLGSKGPPLPDNQWAVLTEASANVLTPGTLVVVNASSLLADGERVTPVLAGEASTQAAQSANTQATGVAQGEREAEAQEATP